MSCGETSRPKDKTIEPAALPATARWSSELAGTSPELRAAYLAARQNEAGPQYGYALTGPAGDTLRAKNPAQDFVAELTPAGARLSRPAGAVTVRLAAWGCPSALTETKPRAPRLSRPEASAATRAEYRQEGGDARLVEWYQNGPLGLEQGFTIESRPGCSAGTDETLRFEVAMEGASGLKEVAGRPGEGPRIEATVGDGAEKLVYSDLYAQDAAARRLPATLSLEGSKIVLTVEARGARYPLSVDPLVWLAHPRIVASDRSAGDLFGDSVAVSDDMAVIGASVADSPTASEAGAAYVFVRSGALWTEQAKLTASDGQKGDYFGNAVAISGSSVVVGAPGAKPFGVQSAGAAYVFVRSGTSWSEQAKLTASDLGPTDILGSAVAISGDTVVVGAYFASRGGLVACGAAYVFVRSGTSWSEQAKLAASDKAAHNSFGSAVTISGNTLVVGAQDAHVGMLAYIGAAYVFVRSGTSWSEQAKLIATDKMGAANFGRSISLSGETVVIGDEASLTAGVRSGAAHVFVRSGTSWSEQAKLVASDREANDWFGMSVSLSGDTLLVGAPQADPDGLDQSGATYVFVRSGTSWSEQAKLTASDKAAGDSFGHSVALAGEVALVSAYAVKDGSATFVGAAYAYRRGKANGDSCMTSPECASEVCVAGSCGKPTGDSCTSSTQCRSGFCVDGVCCGSACSQVCQACSKAAGASVDGTCGLRKAGTSCASAAADKCIAGGSCNGTSPSCSLMPAANTVVCDSSGDATRCIARYRCDGTSTGRCPTTNPAPASNSTVCDPRADAASCIDGYRCNGTTTGSCPTTNPVPAKATVICSSTKVDSQCVANYRCDGVSAGVCPTTNPTPANNLTVCNAAGDASKCVGAYYCDGVAAGVCPTTSAKPASAATVCEAKGDTSKCIESYRCDGVSTGSCPRTQATPAVAGTMCAPADAAKCIASGTCNGTATVCNLMPAANTVVCDNTADDKTCRAGYRCDGSSIGRCPTTNPSPAAAGTMCRAEMSECDGGGLCRGSTASCPPSQPVADGRACSVGSCQAGLCRPEAEPSVALMASPKTAMRQEPVTVTAQIANTGKVAAAQATLSFELPTAPGFSVKQIQGAGWTCKTQDGSASCTRSEIPKGGAPDVTLVVVPPIQQASFTIKATLGSTTYDVNLLNNGAQVIVNNGAPCNTVCPGGDPSGGEPDLRGSGSGSDDAGTRTDPPAMQTGCQYAGQSGSASARSALSTGMGALITALLITRRRARRRQKGCC